ncbi:hypothetical protein VTN96DRAFT_2941 [Rasamsonia emersonii]
MNFELHSGSLQRSIPAPQHRCTLLLESHRPVGVSSRLNCLMSDKLISLLGIKKFGPMLHVRSTVLRSRRPYTKYMYRPQEGHAKTDDNQISDQKASLARHLSTSTSREKRHDVANLRDSTTPNVLLCTIKLRQFSYLQRIHNEFIILRWD